MAAAMRFAFQRGGRSNLLRAANDEAYRVPANPAHARAERCARADLPGRVVRHQSHIRARLAVVYRQRSAVVAWQAHIGGFLAGLLLFSWFDPAPNRPQMTTLLQRAIKQL
jgi:hypothetical protein